MASDVFIHHSAEVDPRAVIGKGTKIWNGAQVREGAIIGEMCNLGKDVYIDSGVRLGKRVRIQNGVSIFKGVHLEDDVFVGPNVCFTNDLYPRAGSENWEIVETFVRHGASIGAGATIVCGVTIGKYALIGVASVVTHDIPPHMLAMGNPARIKSYVCTCGRPAKGIEPGARAQYNCLHCHAALTFPPAE